MSTRPITALMAALALLAVTPAALYAQTPTPTPTATAAQQDDGAAEAPEDASKEVKAIYTDYSRDGVIDVCDHARDDLQEALDTIEPAFDRDFPDFREALEAGIQRHDKNRCDEEEATPTPTATAAPDDSTTIDPTPAPTVDDGTLPDPDTGTDDGGAIPPDDGTLPPDDGGALPEDGTLPEAGTLPPPAASPTPLPSAIPATPTPSPTPAIVTRSGVDGLLIPGIMIGVALLGAAALAFSAMRGGSPGVQHAWSEARYRTRSTWADFSDWLKFGR
jgi:hypothetical protein